MTCMAAMLCGLSHTEQQVVNAPWDTALRGLNGQVHGILSNPPYVTDADAGGLQVSTASPAQPL